MIGQMHCGKDLDPPGQCRSKRYSPARRRFMSGSRPVIWVLSAALISVLALQTAAAQDPLKVAPDMYKLLLENDRVRVMEVVFKPGSKIAKHSHPDHFVYVAEAGKLTLHKGEGAKSDADLKIGDVMW